MNNYPVLINCNGEFLIDVQAESREEAERIARETFEDSKVKDALMNYKNNLKITTRIKEDKEMER